jgi:hypothetical protein
MDRWKDRPNVPLGGWGGTMGNGIETVFPSAIRIGYDTDFVLERLKERIEAGVYPNGWIFANGGGIETLAAVPMTINEAFLQSYEHVVRVFPGWNLSRDVAFDNLRAYGAFLVSSEVKDGKIQFVRIYSERGRKLKIENPWKGQAVEVLQQGDMRLLFGDFLEIDTSAGEIIFLSAIVPAVIE